MIIYGSRATRLKTFDAQNTKCGHCGNSGTIRISIFGRYAHIFWIPLFPIGKKLISECQHCKHTMEHPMKNNGFNQVDQADILETKSPKWYFSGLMLIGGLVLLGSIMDATKEKDVREEMFNQDMNNMQSNPTMVSDSVSFKLKEILDISTPEGLDTKAFKYLTKVNGDKVLILLQVPGLKKMEKNKRPSVLELINNIADEQADLVGKTRYIGVKGNVTMMVSKTPAGLENNTIASEDPFYEFYGERKGKK